jgi:sporulation-control protein spo0M
LGFLKKMTSAITGGGADVSIEYPLQAYKSGDVMHVKVTVLSTGGEVKSNGVFVDLRAREHGHVSGSHRCEKCGDYDSTSRISIDKTTVKQAYPVGPAFVLQENERKEFEADIQIPMGEPTYKGSVQHVWEIRGRLEAFGNDPDSGFKAFEVN